MKKLICLILVIAILCPLSPRAQGRVGRVAFWNVENLFDTLHDEGHEDHEFLPGAKRRWNGQRYWHKLRGISQTIAAMGEGGELPLAVGLCEVENDSCLRDLTQRTALWAAGYGFVMTDSPDRRGVDVALLYRKKEFSVDGWRSVRVPSEQMGYRATRDILVVSGRVLKNGEEIDEKYEKLHFIVVHLPSRQNNNEATRSNRMLAVKTLRGVVDSLMRDAAPAHPAKILVMGDFNAEPSDEIFSLLTPPLRTLMPTDRRTLRGRRGSYYFRRVWGYLDHMLATPAMATMVRDEASECRFPFLLNDDKGYPRRTYGGTTYLGGLSDHLPILVNVEF